ncbi:MAG: hypothetical protein PHG35_03340 [Dehalococcoidales bacterium]|nr:hypothetical protein [Dehalococcoidales bacterium]
MAYKILKEDGGAILKEDGGAILYEYLTLAGRFLDIIAFTKKHHDIAITPTTHQQAEIVTAKHHDITVFTSGG